MLQLELGQENVFIYCCFQKFILRQVQYTVRRTVY